MFWLLVFIAAFFAFSYSVLRGENLSYLDQPPPPREPVQDGEAYREAVAKLHEVAATPLGRGRERIRRIRSIMDDMGREGDFSAEFRSVDTGAVRGEWVLPPDCDPDKRLLYIHGGAFFAGSPISHRPITDQLAKRTGAAVFSLDYRLQPENRRIEGIDDCRAAYRWLLDNGPDGPAPARAIAVGGDSAGGNLTLSLIAWIRDADLRQVDAALAFSPATDAVLDAPSLRDNIDTDPMLGPAFGYLARIPVVLVLWFTWLTTRMLPRDARISPVRDNLAGLPPTLVQVSSTEMLYDDARRYVAKAQAAESPVVLQSWPNMLHVWQMFVRLPEAMDALDNVQEFLEDTSFR